MSSANADVDRAAALLESGQQFLIEKDIPSAVAELSEASEILSEKFGDKAEECAETLLWYGKALLELGKLENVVLCNALEGVDIVGGDDQPEDSKVENPDNLTADEKSEVEEKVADALEENFEKFDQLVDLAMVHSVAEEDESDDDDDEDPIEDEETEDLDEKSEENIEGEDTDNLQLSWEVVELAKAAFLQMVEKSTGEKKTLAETKFCESMMILGEISLENENYTQAVEDFGLCLEKRKSTLPADSRLIAESYYEMGVAQGHLKLWTEGERNLNSAITVLTSRMANLKVTASDEVKQEIADLETLVGEIQQKIADHKEIAAGKIDVSGSGVQGSLVTA